MICNHPVFNIIVLLRFFVVYLIIRIRPLAIILNKITKKRAWISFQRNNIIKCFVIYIFIKIKQT